MNKKIILISTITLLLDQLTKGIIDSMIKLDSSIRLIDKYFYLTNVHNYGAAWGIFKNKTILLIIAAVIALAIIYNFLNNFKDNKRNTIAFGLLLGGILGNLVDRLFIGYVRDFLDFNIFNYNFPVFNLSDTSIVIGTFLLIIAIIKGEDSKSGVSSKKRRTKNKAR